MEELNRPLRKKTTALKEPTDPRGLFSQCQTRLADLHARLQTLLNTERSQQLGQLLPDLSGLGGQIQALKENLSREPSDAQKGQQRACLAKDKEQLLTQIREHHRRIEALRTRLHHLTLDCEQLSREQHAEVGSPLGRVSSSSWVGAGESRWSQADRLFRRSSQLRSEGLAEALLRELASGPQRNLVKGLLNNYQVSSRMGQVLSHGPVLAQWRALNECHDRLL